MFDLRFILHYVIKLIYSLEKNHLREQVKLHSNKLCTIQNCHGLNFHQYTNQRLIRDSLVGERFAFEFENLLVRIYYIHDPV